MALPAELLSPPPARDSWYWQKRTAGVTSASCRASTACCSGALTLASSSSSFLTPTRHPSAPAHPLLSAPEAMGREGEAHSARRCLASAAGQASFSCKWQPCSHAAYASTSSALRVSQRASASRASSAAQRAAWGPTAVRGGRGRRRGGACGLRAHLRQASDLVQALTRVWLLLLLRLQLHGLRPAALGGHERDHKLPVHTATQARSIGTLSQRPCRQPRPQAGRAPGLRDLRRLQRAVHKLATAVREVVRLVQPAQLARAVLPAHQLLY